MTKKDISAKYCIAIALLLIIAKLVLTYGQSVYLYEPVAAKIDDTLMLESAISISNGNWLGEYNYLTLSKYMFFPVYLSIVNALNVPYLIAGQLIWVLTSAVCVFAFSPLIKQNIWRLFLFTILLYNPAVSAAKVQLRAYRDNIFPALCLLCVAGAIGAALRYKSGLKGYLACVFICSVGLGLAYTTREDGVWIAAFAAPALLATAAYVFFDKQASKKLVRIISLAAPFAVTAIVVLAFCFMNYSHYGRFVLSDFTSAEFKAAYGAMTRIKHDTWHAKIAVPRDVRLKLYAHVPELKLLEPLMESKPVYNAYGTGVEGEENELSSAGFYWALRQISAENGVYQTAETARAYWQSIADQIDKLCDNGTLQASARRASTLSPFRAEYILPTLSQTVANIARILTFAEAEPAFDNITIGHGTKDLARYEEYLNEKSNSAAIENSDKPYYSNNQNIAHFALAFIRVIAAALLPIMFIAALYWLYGELKHIIKSKDIETLLSVLIALGLLLAGLLRCGIVGYMFASSFSYNVEKIMYLASAHPLFITFALLGTYMLAQKIATRREQKNG